jgi:hypothetical protein
MSKMKVSNPLTIIAIFAGLAETLATVALVKLPPEIQSIFVYFVMIFPAGIVLLFFFVLFFKNTVLYAPSDFENQSHYLEANQVKENISDQLDKIFTELNKDGIRLTKSEIDKAKSTVVSSVDILNSLTMMEKQIFDFITIYPATRKEISLKFNIHIGTITQFLNNMNTKGAVSCNEDGEWKVNL